MLNYVLHYKNWLSFTKNRTAIKSVWWFWYVCMTIINLLYGFPFLSQCLQDAPLWDNPNKQGLCISAGFISSSLFTSEQRATIWEDPVILISSSYGWPYKKQKSLWAHNDNHTITPHHAYMDWYNPVGENNLDLT